MPQRQPVRTSCGGCGVTLVDVKGRYYVNGTQTFEFSLAPAIRVSLCPTVTATKLPVKPLETGGSWARDHWSQAIAVGTMQCAGLSQTIRAS